MGPPAARSSLAEETSLSTEQGMRMARGSSLLVAVFIITNTFLINVTQRRRQIGIMRAIGTAPPNRRHGVSRGAHHGYRRHLAGFSTGRWRSLPHGCHGHALSNDVAGDRAPCIRFCCRAGGLGVSSLRPHCRVVGRHTYHPWKPCVTCCRRRSRASRGGWRSASSLWAFA